MPTVTWRRLLIVALVVIVVAVVGLGFAAWAAFQQIERVPYDLDGARERLGIGRGDATDGDEAGPSSDAPDDGDGESDGDAGDPADVDEPGIPQDPVTDPREDVVDVYLVVGLDAESPGGQSRADVILLGFLPGDGRDPGLVSLPRDLWIDDLCHGGRQRINAALGGCGSRATGQELLMLTVEEFTGVPVEHYVQVDFEGFEGVVDVVGGIEICTEHAVRDARSGLRMPAGCVQADGEQALAWVRSRRTQERVDGRWQRMSRVDDLTRNERQQDVLLDVAEKVAATRSLGRLRAITAELAEEVVLGQTLTSERLARTVWRWRGADRDDVRRASLDVEYHVTSGGASVLLPDQDFAEVLDELGFPELSR